MQTPNPLTEESVLAYLRDMHTRQRRMPSISETATHFGHRSPTSIQRIFASLCEKGCLQRHGLKYGLAAEAIRPKGLPILGAIAAGQPIEAIEANQDERFDLGEAYDPDIHFGLRVKGDSMIEALIGDGDIAITNEIVAAVIDGEATLKRFFRKKDHIQLKAENSKYKPIKAREVEIRGVLVGVLRMYSGR
jgi:repressor LexA